jgi:hypothetical protein
LGNFCIVTELELYKYIECNCLRIYQLINLARFIYKLCIYKLINSEKIVFNTIIIFILTLLCWEGNYQSVWTKGKFKNCQNSNYSIACLNELTTLKNNFSVIKASISPWVFAGIAYFKCHIMTIFSFLIFQFTLLKRIRVNTIFRKLNNKPA